MVSISQQEFMTWGEPQAVELKRETVLFLGNPTCTFLIVGCVDVLCCILNICCIPWQAHWADSSAIQRFKLLFSCFTQNINLELTCRINIYIICVESHQPHTFFISRLWCLPLRITFFFSWKPVWVIGACYFWVCSWK